MQNKELLHLERKLMLVGILLFMTAWYLGVGRITLAFSVKTAIQDFCMMLAIASLQWQSARLFLGFFRKKYPHYSQVLPRVLFTVVISGLSGMLLTSLVYSIPSLLSESRAEGFLHFADHFAPMFFYSLLVVGAHEVVFNFFELRRIDKEKEELKKAHLQSQLDSLKTQVNPHFLFNSINTVLSLIPTSPEKAEAFLIELSSVYRYLLQANEKQLTTLQQELQFAHSYFHLLKTRFGDAIRLEVDIEEKWLQYQLPSLTLQLLLENAVKHNVISPTKPLTITLRTEKQRGEETAFLTVQNNLQRKALTVTSHKMGLSNILSKFRLLNQDEVVVTDKDNCFTVILPLLKKQFA